MFASLLQQTVVGNQYYSKSKLKSWIRNETENRNQERRRQRRKNDEELMKDVMRRSRNNYAYDLSQVETSVPYVSLTGRVKLMN